MRTIINDLLDYGKKHNFEIKLINTLDSDTPSIASTFHQAIVINMNWHNQRQIPFIICHEISHLLMCNNHDAQNMRLRGRFNFEYQANCNSIKMLIPYYLELIDEKENINYLNFMNYFAIPSNLQNECHKYLKSFI
ncbi:ImmA/IrrE family metallo-endopeptidase [Fructilactobacillus vespulae]|uniref:ImmA/IrrE family metallo-endopeptidase n=1 Tax=Fructilactobacillus vespulae TaxID=1249630 RepID=UPI0039B3BCDD